MYPNIYLCNLLKSENRRGLRFMSTSPSDTPGHQFQQVAADLDLHPIDTQEHDACALICAVRKGGQPTHGNVKRTIEALARMGHRTGYVNGEGDGVGVLTDIPRQLWSKWLAEAGMMSSLASDRNFWVAHVMIPAKDRPRALPLIQQISRRISESGLHTLMERHGVVDSHVLGPNAEKAEPDFWQIAGVNGQVQPDRLERTLFDLQVQLEDDLGVHFPSFSSHSVVYKVQGTIEILRRYYPELRDPDYASTVTMGHARYSTNTQSVFERVQPFSLLGHNGEFNTISRFRMEAAMLGIPLPENGSDSQDVDRIVHALTARYDMDLIEAMEYVFPPFSHDLIQNAPDIHRLYEEMKQSLGHFAQGPAAVASRMGNLCVFSVDSAWAICAFLASIRSACVRCGSARLRRNILPPQSAASITSIQWQPAPSLSLPAKRLPFAFCQGAALKCSIMPPSSAMFTAAHWSVTHPLTIHPPCGPSRPMR
jgi:glutamate synthase (NADPH) large chain